MQGIKNAASNHASGYIKKEHSSMEEYSYYPLELYSLCFSNTIDRLFCKVVLNQHTAAEVGFQTDHHNGSSVKGIRYSLLDQVLPMGTTTIVSEVVVFIIISSLSSLFSWNMVSEF